MSDLVKALRGELLDCDCAAHGSCECCCDTVWPEDVVRKAADRIEQLEAELAECRRDAERYRWMRNVGQEKCEVFLYRNNTNAPHNMTTWHAYTDMDEAIDAAMMEQQHDE